MAVAAGSNSVEVYGARNSIVVGFNNHGAITISGPGGSVVVPGIEWSPAQGRFIGTSTDENVAVAPGERKPRRDALVVLAEEITKALAALGG